MSGINEKNLTSFFGSVPAPMELSFLGLCLGAPMDYDVDKNTGLKKVSMLIPQEGKMFQPVVVTLGKDDCIAAGARSAIYHACHLDNIINGIGDPYAELSDRFVRKIDMGSNNNYITTFFEPKYAKLREEIVRHYPEDVSTLDAAKDKYVSVLTSAFSSNKENDDKKKQITQPAM